jgi:uncharacterized protein (TIGR01777 family)
MRIIVSGASGLVGSALLSALGAAGHDVVQLIRPPRRPGSRDAVWDPATGQLDPAIVSGADAVINLSGSSISRNRWNTKVKEVLRSSRLDSTRTMVEAIGAAEQPPSLLVNASAVGYYGNRGDEVLDESSLPGSGFLSDLCRDWENAAASAGTGQTRVVALRLGIVVADGGALERMLLPFKLGLGGPIGSGRQFWAWIAIADVVGAIRFILDHGEVDGPVNLVSPEETRCADFSRTLGRVLRRPAVLPAPSFAVRAALGEMADELLLASARVRPSVLEKAGYDFRYPALEDAIRTAVK